MASNKSPLREILVDEPARKDQFHGKGHERTAEALVRAITSMEGHDRAIGLDGPWGSGKSSVVEIARNFLSVRRQKDGPDFRFFTFDIWQSQGSSFRRSFLERFLDWTKANFPSSRSELEQIEREVKGKVREVQSKNQSILDWWGILVITAIPFLPIYYFWAKKDWDATQGLGFLTTYSFVLLLVFALATFGRALWLSKAGAKIGPQQSFGVRYRQSLSQTLLISSKQFEDQKVTQYIRETDPNDFEFQLTLRRVLSVVQRENARVVVVLDNIDRLPRKEINDYWAQVRAVFSNGPSHTASGQRDCVIAIIPYDRHLVETEQKAPAARTEPLETSEDQPALISPFGTREIFSKTFDEILQVSPPVMSNSRDFFIEKIGKALPGFADRDELFRVFLIFDHILRHKKGSATPRQIIAFINELTGMYILHGGRFHLPTVAVYIAHQDSLEANPGILNQPSSIDPRLRALADDHQLANNLAAMIFNVDPDLALQLLLDNRIKDAAAESASSLIEMSKAQGFDLRVDAVVQENVTEWEHSGEFPKVVSHFAQLSGSYEGDARVHFRKSLVTAVLNLESLSLDPKDHEPLLDIFAMARKEDHGDLTRAILTAVSNNLPTEELTIDHGKLWTAFVGRIRQRLTQQSNVGVLQPSMAVFPFPIAPAFFFGVAASVAEHGMPFRLFNPKKPDVTKNESYFAEIAPERPVETSAAFAAMKSVGMLPDERIKAAFTSVVALAGNGDIEDSSNFLSQIELLAELYAYMPLAKRGELDATPAFGRAHFYGNLYQSIEDGDEHALAAAMFLALAIYPKDAPPDPTASADASRTSDDKEAYSWFKAAMASNDVLTEDHFRRIAALVKVASMVTGILQRGAATPGNLVLAGIVRAAFIDEPPPEIALATLLKYYGYLEDVLGDEMRAAVDRYAARVSAQDLDALQLAESPRSFVSDIRLSEVPRWREAVEKVKGLLRAVPIDTWREHLAKADHMAVFLWDFVEGSEFEIADPAFREIYLDFVLGVLAGSQTAEDTDRYDLILDAIGKNFHSDLHRQVRERIRDVSSASLTKAARVLPATLSKVITNAERLSKDEKDNLVRFVLCPALEAAIPSVLSSFVALGSLKVRDMVKQSEDSTRGKLKGALDAFSTSSGDREWVKRMGELVYGKRKARSFFDIWFGARNETGDDDE